MELGGYFSVKRNTMSINGDTFLAVDQVVPYCKALLEVFRCACLSCPPGCQQANQDLMAAAVQCPVKACDTDRCRSAAPAMAPITWSSCQHGRIPAVSARGAGTEEAALHQLMAVWRGVCRDHGSREDRQKTRLMWLVEEWGADKFREMVGQQMGGVTLRKGIEEQVGQSWPCFIL